MNKHTPKLHCTAQQEEVPTFLHYENANFDFWFSQDNLECIYTEELMNLNLLLCHWEKPGFSLKEYFNLQNL